MELMQILNLITQNMLNSSIDQHMWAFFHKAREKNSPVSGPMLKAKALKALLKLQKHDFIACSGWMDAFVSRHKLRWPAYMWRV